MEARGARIAVRVSAEDQRKIEEAAKYCLRCDFLPECHMASTEIRDRRRSLRYPHLLVRQSLPPFPAFLVDSLLCDHGHNCTKGERSRRGGRGRVLEPCEPSCSGVTASSLFCRLSLACCYRRKASVSPPSTGITCPVVFELSSLARKTMALAQSRG